MADDTGISEDWQDVDHHASSVISVPNSSDAEEDNLSVLSFSTFNDDKEQINNEVDVSAELGGFVNLMRSSDVIKLGESFTDSQVPASDDNTASSNNSPRDENIASGKRAATNKDTTRKEYISNSKETIKNESSSTEPSYSKIQLYSLIKDIFKGDAQAYIIVRDTTFSLIKLINGIYRLSSSEGEFLFKSELGSLRKELAPLLSNITYCRKYSPKVDLESVPWALSQWFVNMRRELLTLQASVQENATSSQVWDHKKAERFRKSLGQYVHDINIIMPKITK